MLLTSYFLVSWIPTVLTLNGMSAEHAAMAAVIINCGGIAGTLILSFIIGHRSPLAPVAVCLCSGAILIALLGHGIVSPGNTKLLLVFGVGLVVIGAQAASRRWACICIQRRVYATAGGLSVAYGRLGSIIGPLVGGYLVSAKLGWSRLFMLAAVPAMLAALAMAALALIGQSEGERR